MMHAGYSTPDSSAKRAEGLSRIQVRLLSTVDRRGLNGVVRVLTGMLAAAATFHLPVHSHAVDRATDAILIAFAIVMFALTFGNAKT